jgi:phage tail sheath protein FI
MADTFLHGIETIEVASSTGTVSTVKTGVIGLIGTSPKGALNAVKLCLSETDDDQFGDETNTTGTIRQALYEIRKQLSSTVVFVINLSVTDTVEAAAFATGLGLFSTCRANYGFIPKTFIAPGYSDVEANALALITIADTYRGCAYLDCPSDMTYATALTSRGEDGQWNFSKYRAKLFFPRAVNSDSIVRPYSAYAAGLRAQVDLNEGFWYSSSNHNVEGISSLIIPLSWELNDASCQVNQLNAIGITTLVNVYGSGFREWGNRNSAYPTNEDTRSFEAMQRLDDITSESIELASLPYIDKPMNKAQINIVTEKVNSYFNTLISRGALIQGSKCTFDAAKNSTTEMAKGHYVWTKTFMGATPGERLTFYSKIDTSLLSNLLTA